MTVGINSKATRYIERERLEDNRRVGNCSCVNGQFDRACSTMHVYTRRMVSKLHSENENFLRTYVWKRNNMCVAESRSSGVCLSVHAVRPSSVPLD